MTTTQRTGAAWRRVVCSVALLLTVLMMAAVAADTAGAGAPTINAPVAAAPNIRGKNSTSSNWSGYATVRGSLTTPTAGTVTNVVGSWTVPTVTTTSGDSYSAAWVGIDGYASKTVEQIGTSQDWVNGSARYYAWWEMYPKPSKLISNVAIHPNDRITADVTYLGNKRYRLTITNVTTGKSFTTAQKGNGSRSSAEWIMEAPSSGGVLPLAQFGSIAFSNCTFNNGLPIDAPGWLYDPITLATGGTPLATPSGLKAGGTAFTVPEN